MHILAGLRQQSKRTGTPHQGYQIGKRTDRTSAAGRKHDIVIFLVMFANTGGFVCERREKESGFGDRFNCGTPSLSRAQLKPKETKCRLMMK